MNEIYGRHGDLVIQKEAVPPGVVLTKQKAPLVLAGKEEGSHTIADFENVEFVLDGEVQRLRVLNPVTLVHGARHKTVLLEPGEYVVYPLAEMSGDLARRVDD